MKRRILLVDDEVAVLLTLKAVLEISGFDVDTAASAREGKSKLHTREYHMIITDMRMESDAAGAEVIKAARSASYHPAVALLTAFPVSEDDWQEMGADKLLVKPVHTRILLEQIENLLISHQAKLERLGETGATSASTGKVQANSGAKKTPAKKHAHTKTSSKRAVEQRRPAPQKKQAAGKAATKHAVKAAAGKRTVKKVAVKKVAVKKVAAKRVAAKRVAVKKVAAKEAAAPSSAKKKSTTGR